MTHDFEETQLHATGYTRVYDELARAVGLIAAAVYGRVWWYARGPLGRCVASQSRIAHDLGLSRKTVNRKLADLIEAGYLKDLTGKRRYRPHELLITDKLSIPAQMGGTTKAKPVPVPQPDPSASPPVPPVVPPSPMLREAGGLKDLNKVNRDSKKEEEEKDPTPLSEADTRLNQSLSFANMIYLPEIRHFHATTGQWPLPAQARMIVTCMQQHDLLTQDLRPYWHTWVSRGHNPRNLAWLLEWAARGEMPQRAKAKPARATSLDKYTSGEFAQFIER